METVEIRVRGQVQGVGFRPFVWRLAQELGLSGHVLNDAGGVVIRVRGAAVEALVARLRGEAPVLARVDQVEVSRWLGALAEGFVILASEAGAVRTRVTPDAASCPDCLAEVAGTGRRAGYAFTNCTHCGPRFSIVTGLPYDRAQTTMAAFALCADCAEEYRDPADRRFHAQPIACPICGPKVWCVPEAGDWLAAAAARLRAGEILAIKGLGGFHIACDAGNPQAIARLRARKHRPAKPLAVMGDPAMIEAACHVSDPERALLRDPAAPIVVLTLRARATGVAARELAPGQGCLGWMLPYTPLHHLLVAATGRPLVMTSGNPSGEPQVIGNEEALAKLGGIVDGFVLHDRAIARRLDDSVERMTPQGPMVLRRARGRVPDVLDLPEGFREGPQVIAYGGQMKGAICLVREGQALLGHHLGDLDNALNIAAFEAADRDYRALFEHSPDLVAVDLHPEFRATRYGEARAQAEGVGLVRVQHHHAHLAACLAENGWARLAGPVAGIVLDGLGLGEDGHIWGGEILLGEYATCQRVAHLSQVPLPGGDRASRDPWRNLLAQLDHAGLGALADLLLSGQPLALLRQAMAKGLNAPSCSSAGRLFDAFAAALGFAGSQSFEGEAAMGLEALARKALQDGGVCDGYPFGAGEEIDTRPLWQAWAQDRARAVPPEIMALRFHRGLAQAFAQRASDLVRAGRAQAVALSGGCLQNTVLQDELVAALAGVPVLLHHKVPANDGGLALGQAVIGMARAMGESQAAR
ncbi:carbamoyltransferase HypF [Thioclava litoralis]|uniref:Carbamoyltransferase HypF n=1 Tax=Thioclava litoralis TaxID=3076557 RepID=A0ABZ1DYE7_9RHOB|nr:carbamoyltransferase HypF [Thioclava sp. FTW29]